MNYYIILQLLWLSVSLERSYLQISSKTGRKSPVEQDGWNLLATMNKAKKRINLSKTFRKLRALQKTTEAKTRLVIIHSMYCTISSNYQIMQDKYRQIGSGMEAFAFTSGVLQAFRTKTQVFMLHADFVSKKINKSSHSADISPCKSERKQITGSHIITVAGRRLNL